MDADDASIFDPVAFRLTAEEAALAARVRAFAGGVVNDGTRDLGTGATLAPQDTDALYAAWCSRPYASEFLLYKLYTFAAAFSRRIHR